MVRICFLLDRKNCPKFELPIDNDCVQRESEPILAACLEVAEHDVAIEFLNYLPECEAKHNLTQWYKNQIPY